MGRRGHRPVPGRQTDARSAAVLPLIRKQWQPFVTAAAIPAVTMAAGWALTVDARSYLDTTLTYMGEVRDY